MQRFYIMFLVLGDGGISYTAVGEGQSKVKEYIYRPKGAKPGLTLNQFNSF